MKFLSPILALLLLTGCVSSLVPKKVEFFQDKVHTVPEPSAREKEVQRQVAARTAAKALQTYSAAITNHCVPDVVVPAGETLVLAESVSRSVGPPVNPASVNEPSKDLATRLDTAVAKLNQRFDEFKKDNNENAGKKIEGTGFLQIPYFIWLLICAAAAFVGLIILGVLWTAVKMYSLSNPPVALGVKAVQTSAAFAKRALTEVIQGGEEFKNALVKEFNDPALQEKVKTLFRLHQERKQSEDTQELIKELTK